MTTGNITSGYQYFPQVCISGSMRFYPEMLELAAELTEQGMMVIMPHALKNGRKNTSQMLDLMHRRKIVWGRDGLYVVTNPAMYIGQSTSREIKFAEEIGRKILWDKRGAM